VIAASDVAPGTATEVLVDGRAVALFNVAGTFHALSNRCIHRGGPLGQGVLDGQAVICPWHAWSYDVTTGLNTANPEIRVDRYEVRVEEGQVMVKVD
jgi:nitrite reductase/ring-hydroxylating ferredoxin subunit